MRTRRTWRLAAIAAASTAGAGGGAAVAATQLSTSRAGQSDAGRLDAALRKAMSRGGPGEGRPGHGHGRLLGLPTAATYLGPTEAELRAALRSDGNTLAEVARAEGEPVAGLVAALVEAAEKRRRHARGGRLTADGRSAELARLEGRIADVVRNGRPARHGAPELRTP